MRNCGYITLQWKVIDKNTREKTALVWGKLTRDAEVKTFTKQKCECNIKIDAGTFLNVFTWSDNPCYDTMIYLEKGDIIVAFGTMIEKKWINKKNEEKISYELDADIVIPQAAITGQIAMANNAQINRLMSIQDSRLPDEFESVDDEFVDLENGGVPDDYDYDAVDAVDPEVPFK